MSENISLSADMSQADEALDNFKRRSEEIVQSVNQQIQETEQKTSRAVRKVVALGRMGYEMVDNLTRGFGLAIPPVIGSLIRGALSVASVFANIFTAEAITPGMEAAAALGFAELALLTANISMVIQGQTEMVTQLRAAQQGLFNMGTFVNALSFF